MHLMAPVSPYDDAYITYRYVQNIELGRGPVFNQGEQVLGVSCPLYMGWLAGLREILPGISIPALSARGNAVLLAASALLAILFMRALGFRLASALVGGASVASCEWALRSSIGGMESSLYLTLMLAALLALTSRHDMVAVLLASLATLTRPEGVLLVLVALVICFLDRPGKSPPWRLLLGLIPLAAWGLWATMYYGTPVPHSVIAKARPLYPLAQFSALDALLAHGGRWLLGSLLALDKASLNLSGVSGWGQVWRGVQAQEALAQWSTMRFVIQIAHVAFTGWALARWWRPITSAGLPRRLALPACVVLLTMFYAFSNPLLLAWYMPLIQVPWLILVLGACLAPGRSGRASGVWRAAAVTMVISTAITGLLYALVIPGRSLIVEGAADYRTTAKFEAYKRAAAWLEKRSAASASVAAAEIGIIGYMLDRRILDACALVTPEALPFIPPKPEERGRQLGPIPTGFIVATKPDYVITLPSFIELTLLKSSWFGSNYQLVHEEPYRVNEPMLKSVMIFQRR